MNARNGFTLLEMLLVVLIIGALAAMVVPRLLPRAEEARVQIAYVEVTANVSAALDLFMLNVGRYPTTEEGLAALWSRPSTVPEGKWKGPYIKKSRLVDPWGNTIAYYSPARRGGLDYDLISLGPDGAENTADDITNGAGK